MALKFWGKVLSPVGPGTPLSDALCLLSLRACKRPRTLPQTPAFAYASPGCFLSLPVDVSLLRPQPGYY